MKKLILPALFALCTGCDVTDELGVDFHAVGELNYKEVQRHTLEVDGKSYKIREIEGRDPETGEVFVRIFEGSHPSGRFECVGQLENCPAVIRKLDTETSQGD